MRIPHYCKKCEEEYKDDIFFIDVDNNFFEGKSDFCNNHHEIFVVTSSPKYPFILQQGIEAYNLGFYFESYHCLYAGLETYRKEFVESYIFYQLKEDSISEKLKMTSKKMKEFKLSERVLGAFNIAYISLMSGESPDNIKENSIKKRNKIIHNGRIPEKIDCEKLGNEIFKLIANYNKKLWDIEDEVVKKHNIIMDYFYQKSLEITSNQGYTFKNGFPKDLNLSSYSINLLSPNTILDKKDINDTMFTQESAKKRILINHHITIQ